VSGSQPGVVQVKIYDREYTFRTSGDPARLQSLCIELDRLMRKLAAASGSVDTLKVAILAALSLSDELATCREELQKIDESLSRRSMECVSLLDRFLGAGSARNADPNDGSGAPHGVIYIDDHPA
jgi:cell division protein ZapA